MVSFTCAVAAAAAKCFGSVRLFATLWTVAHRAPLSVGFSRQEYWSALPCPLQGIFPTQGSNAINMGVRVEITGFGISPELCSNPSSAFY